MSGFNEKKRVNWEKFACVFTTLCAATFTLVIVAFLINKIMEAFR